jgi:hypothetical protein
VAGHGTVLAEGSPSSLARATGTEVNQADASVPQIRATYAGKPWGSREFHEQIEEWRFEWHGWRMVGVDGVKIASGTGQAAARSGMLLGPAAGCVDDTVSGLGLTVGAGVGLFGWQTATAAASGQTVGGPTFGFYGPTPGVSGGVGSSTCLGRP